MGTEPELVSSFSRFAQGVRGFESTLYKIVISSFIFSSIGAFMHGDPRTNPALAAITTLLGTIGGIAGVLTAFISWSYHPLDQFRKLIALRASEFASRIGLWFSISIVALCTSFYLSQSGTLASVAILPIATFFFFRAIAIGFLVVRNSEVQELTWASMTPDERAAWAAAEKEEEERKLKMRSVLQKMRYADVRISGRFREIRNMQKALLRRMFYDRLRNYLEPLHSASVNLRVALANDLLLLPSERRNRLDIKMRAEKFREQWITDAHKETYGRIKDGTLHPLPLEGTSVKVFSDHHQHFFFISEPINEAGARELMNSFASFRDADTGKFGNLVGLVEGGTEVSVEARNCLIKEGVSLYRTANWRPL